MSISAKAVKELRDLTGLGMMDCKKALTETDGDKDKAIEWLRKKGMAKSSKLAGRIAAEGLVTSYIHAGGKVGVLLELNCETDFTAKNDDFQTLAKDISMHIAAVNPRFINEEDVPEAVLEKERDIARAAAREAGKPENVIDRIADGKIKKFYEENCLLNQKWVKDPDQTVKQLIDGLVGRIGEKMTVRRFARFALGEGLEKRQDNFAEEVAKQAGGN